jgi:hypothetical protein
MKSYDDIKLNIIVPVSSAGVLDVYDISDETKLRIIVENAGVLNTVIVSGRIIGQTGFTELKTVVGSSNTLVNISSYDHIKIECTVYESLNSSPIKVIAASFSNAGGSAIESIDVPSGDDLADVDKLIFSSSDGSVIITGNSTTNTVDFTVDTSVGAVTSVNTQTGDVVLTKSDLGLSDVDNTSDINKPISTATQTALNGKEPLITGGTTSQYWRGDKSWQTLDKSSVGLSNVDNTSDANKPISTATQTALNAKYDASNPAGYVDAAGAAAAAPVQSVAGKVGIVTLAKADVGLSNVDNTSDLNKPISTATQTALDLITDVNWTGDYNNGTTYTVGDGVMFNGASFRMIIAIGAAGYDPVAYPANWLQVTDYVSPNDIGLGNVDNTSDVNKPISSATQTALNAKQDSLGFTPENVTNKSTNTSLGTSDTLYPTENAVKSYVDTQITNNSTPDATTLVKGKVKLAGDLAGTADLPTVPGLAGKEPTITAGTTSQYYRGDKTFQTLDKSAVGLSNVDNTSDANKPISSATQTALNAKVETSLVGAINGVASLDGTGKVPSTQLPSYVDDVVEYANLAAFPVTGETSKIYVALDTNKCYRWSGSAYVEISPSEVNSVAGKTGIVLLVKADVGLSNVDNTSDADKPISSATQTALNGKANSSHVHALSDLTQSAATNGQVPSWNGTNWVPSTPATVITDHTLLSNIGTNTHANIDTHIAATSAVHGVTGSVVGTSDSQALTNKTIDADLNTLSNIENADIKAAAAIDRTKLASGTANRIVINDGTGVMADAAAITASRALVSDASGIPTASAVTSTELGYVSGVTSAIQTQIGAKQNTITGAATTITTADLTASRAVVSDASGKIDVSAATSTEVGYLSGVTSAIQTQINGKQNSLGFTPEDVANKSTTTSLGTSDTLYPTQNAVKTYVDNAVTGGATPDATTLVKGKVKLAGDLAGTADLPTVPGLATKEPTITATTSADYYRGDKTFQTLNKAAVGLSNVDNTSDADKPVSSATQTALNAKENSITAGTTGQYWRGDKSFQTLDKTAVGLSNVDNTSDADKPISSATQTALNAKYDASNPSNYVNAAGAAAAAPVQSVAGKTGIVTLDKTDVGLSNVDNTSDLNKPISTATQTALNGKENTITAGTTGQYYRGDKTFQTLDKAAVGLANVDNTSDANKPISTATATALSGKANTAHVHALSDLTQSSATSGQVPSWNGTNWVPVTPSAGVTDHTLLTNIGTNTHAQIDTFMANTTNVYTDTKEPTGFVNRNHSTISFDDASRTFTIQPTSGSFDVYIRGTKYIKTVAENTVISTTNGNHYIYYNASGALTSTTIFTSDIIEQYAFVAIVYWNSDTGTHTYFAEERHGITMDGATHSYLHTIFGARYLTGLALQGFTVDGAGNLNTEAQFTADGGNIRDEDILHELPPQTQIPIYYRQGQLWRRKTPDSYPVIYSGTAGYTGASGRIPYNEYVAGTWQLTEVANNAFVLVHFFATNDVDDHIIGIQGTNTYGNVTAARVAAASEISSLSGLPFAEFVALGSVVFESSNSFTNAPKCIVRSVNGGDYVDFRGTQLYTPAGTATTHGLLSGLSNDDHAQYHTDARGDARYQLKSAGDISETSFLLTNNQAVAANITGLAFNNAATRSFTALISIYINATSSLYEQITIEGIQKGSSWDISVSNVGDNSGISFSITNAGQIQYTSINYTGFVSGVIKFRAITTSV